MNHASIPTDQPRLPPLPTDARIVLPGGAGLVGQNLLVRLKASGYRNLVVLDKHAANLVVLRSLHPEVLAELADLAEPGPWTRHFATADAVVMLQAQIGGPRWEDFQRNNIDATRLILEQVRLHAIPRLIAVSSSVVESVADDFYSRSKRAQEQMVLASGIPCPVLRPTLMFGWFDRKHLGWLSRFMRKVPVFPVPGDGRYLRQPLYVGDFCQIILACLDGRVADGVYDISGQETIDYIDMIRVIRAAVHARTLILRIPYGLFHALLWVWGRFDQNPPFTTQQLAALVARDEFRVIDWPGLFGVPSTGFAAAVEETFNDPRYSHVVLEF